MLVAVRVIMMRGVIGILRMKRVLDEVHDLLRQYASTADGSVLATGSPMRPEQDHHADEAHPGALVDLGTERIPVAPTPIITGEPVRPIAVSADDPELRSMTVRFWISASLAIPLMLVTMGAMDGGRSRAFLELALATPVCTWARRRSQPRDDAERQAKSRGGLVYNAAGIPLAAGVLYPFTGWLLSPMLAALAMSLSSVSVIANALRLRMISI